MLKWYKITKTVYIPHTNKDSALILSKLFLGKIPDKDCEISIQEVDKKDLPKSDPFDSLEYMN